MFYALKMAFDREYIVIVIVILNEWKEIHYTLSANTDARTHACAHSKLLTLHNTHCTQLAVSHSWLLLDFQHHFIFLVNVCMRIGVSEWVMSFSIPLHRLHHYYYIRFYYTTMCVFGLSLHFVQTTMNLMCTAIKTLLAHSRRAAHTHKYNLSLPRFTFPCISSV